MYKVLIVPNEKFSYGHKELFNTLRVLLRENLFVVNDNSSDVSTNEEGKQDLIITFLEDDYRSYSERYPSVPVFLFAIDEQQKTDHLVNEEHVMFMTADKKLRSEVGSDHLFSIPITEFTGIKDAKLEYDIVLCISDLQAYLRSLVLLNTISELSIVALTLGRETEYNGTWGNHIECRECTIDRVDDMIAKSKLVIGDQFIAHKAVLAGKNTIVTGYYGCGGYIDSSNVVNQYNHNYGGMVDSDKGAYFSLCDFNNLIMEERKIPDERVYDVIRSEIKDNNQKILKRLSACLVG